MTNSPWAKLMMAVALKIMLKPRAIRAYMAPLVRPEKRYCRISEILSKVSPKPGRADHAGFIKKGMRINAREWGRAGESDPALDH